MLGWLVMLHQYSPQSVAGNTSARRNAFPTVKPLSSDVPYTKMGPLSAGFKERRGFPCAVRKFGSKYGDGLVDPLSRPDANDMDQADADQVGGAWADIQDVDRAELRPP